MSTDFLRDCGIRSYADPADSLRSSETRQAVESGHGLAPLLALALAFATGAAFVREAWAAQSFQIGVFTILAVAALRLDWRDRPPLSAYLPLCLPFWGMVQIFTQATGSIADTRTATLRWGALAAVYVLAFRLGRRESDRRLFLELFLWFATASAVLCLAQLFTSGGKVLWLFETGYGDVYGTFPYYNNYAQFVELALPVALWGALTGQRSAWAYAVAGGALYASVIGSASRAGTLLVTAELAAILILGLRSGRGRSGALLIIPAIALAFTAVVGWERVWSRFLVNDPYVVRREYLITAVEMAKRRPLAGFGLDTFPAAYRKYAIKDFPFYANHAHNDWAEAAAEGGIPFLAALLIPFLIAAPKAIRSWWGLGLVAVMVHACVDYPFARPAVSGWIFALLGLINAQEAPSAPLSAAPAASISGWPACLPSAPGTPRR